MINVGIIGCGFVGGAIKVWSLRTFAVTQDDQKVSRAT